jgi:hypothetical protein
MKKFTLEEPQNLGARALGCLWIHIGNCTLRALFIHNTFSRNSQKSHPENFGVGVWPVDATEDHALDWAARHFPQQARMPPRYGDCSRGHCPCGDGRSRKCRILGNSARRGNFRAAEGVEKLELPARGNPHRHDSPVGGLLAPGTTIGAPLPC